MKLLIRGQWGLGDNIFARPFLRAAAQRFDLYLETPWPELYDDLPIRFVLADRKLRTQQKNIMRQSASRWSQPPRGIREARIGYGGADLASRSIVATLERQFAAIGVRVQNPIWDMPELGDSPVVVQRPIAVVRPVTVRSEWRNEARNPRPEYVNAIAEDLIATHEVVSVADLSAGAEWPAGALPPSHRVFHNGELDVRALLALTAAADIVIGGVGWIVPAAVASGTKAFIVLGGHGGHNAPEKITDPRMDLGRIGFAMPRRFCRCTSMLHHCDKSIPDLMCQWSIWRERTRLRADSPAAA